MKSILVLCTGNSCRSILAEALINDLGAGKYRAWSAGSTPAGYVHPGSLETLERHSIAVPANPKSQSWDEFTDQHFDFVITVCDSAAGEQCPLFLGPQTKLHWSTPDPAHVQGTEAEIRAAFDEVFFMLKERIEAELL